MAEEDYKEIAESFFVDISKYISEDDKVDLRRLAKDYIKENKVFDIITSVDTKMYANSLLFYLKEYFVEVQTDSKEKIFQLTENGKNRLRQIQSF